MDTLQSHSYEKSPNIPMSCDHPSDRFPECTTRIILFYTILDIRTNIKRGCSSHIRRYKIACGLIESIKRSARARSFPFFTTEIWESIPPYIDIYIYIPPPFDHWPRWYMKRPWTPRSRGYEPPNWFESFLDHNAG